MVHGVTALHSCTGQGGAYGHRPFAPWRVLPSGAPGSPAGTKRRYSGLNKHWNVRLWVRPGAAGVPQHMHSRRVFVCALECEPAPTLTVPVGPGTGLRISYLPHYTHPKWVLMLQKAHVCPPALPAAGLRSSRSRTCMRDEWALKARQSKHVSIAHTATPPAWRVPYVVCLPTSSSLLGFGDYCNSYVWMLSHPTGHRYEIMAWLCMPALTGSSATCA